MAFNRTLQHFTSSQELATQWANGQSYVLNQLVINDDVLYRCLVAHTSAALFATDLASAKWVAISSAGASGGKNYVQNPDFNDGNADNWEKITLATALPANKIPTNNITIGATGLTTFQATDSTPLEGTHSLLAGGNFTAGEGFATKAFQIDREDQAKVLGFSFSYERLTGTMDFSGTSANTLAIYIAEVNSAAPETVVNWIQPAGVYNMVQSSGVGLASGTFQTSATGTHYRLVVLCINSASTVSMEFDDFQLGPQKVTYGAPVTDWQDYTPTASSASGSITNATHRGRWRRVGDTLEAQVRTTFSAATATFGQIFYTLPNQVSVDRAKLPTDPNGSVNIIGSAYFRDAGVANFVGIVRHYVVGSSDFIEVQPISAPASATLTPVSADNISQAYPVSFNLNDEIISQFRIPIAGWSSNTAMSSDTDTRVVAGLIKTTNSSTNIVSTNQITTGWSVTNDTHAAFSSTGQYTIPVSGYYVISAFFRTSSLTTTGSDGGIRLAIYIDGVEDISIARDTAGNAITKSFNLVGSSAPIFLTAGKVVDVRFLVASSGSTVTLNGIANQNYWAIERLSGPATIAAASVVMARASGPVNTAFTATPTNPGYQNITFDTHGTLTGGTGASSGVYTVPVSGYYRVSTCVRLVNNQSLTAGKQINTNIFKNGSYNQAIGGMFAAATISPANGPFYYASGTVYANAGETLEVRHSNDQGTLNLLSNASGGSLNWVSFERIGGVM